MNFFFKLMCLNQTNTGPKQQLQRFLAELGRSLPGETKHIQRRGKVNALFTPMRLPR